MKKELKDLNIKINFWNKYKLNIILKMYFKIKNMKI